MAEALIHLGALAVVIAGLCLAAQGALDSANALMAWAVNRAAASADVEAHDD